MIIWSSGSGRERRWSERERESAKTTLSSPFHQLSSSFPSSPFFLSSLPYTLFISSPLRSHLLLSSLFTHVVFNVGVWYPTGPLSGGTGMRAHPLICLQVKRTWLSKMAPPASRGCSYANMEIFLFYIFFFYYCLKKTKSDALYVKNI